MAGKRYGYDDWRAVRAALGLGMSVRDAAAATGVGRQTVFRWSRLGDAPAGVMARGERTAGGGAGRTRRQRLDYEDRAYIASGLAAGLSVARVAAAVGVARSTVYREPRRSGEGPYDPREAQARADSLARGPRPPKLAPGGPLRAYVVRGLSRRWSPEQISHRLVLDLPGDAGMRVSHETICRALYSGGAGSLRGEVDAARAPRSGRGRRRRRRRPSPARGGRPWVEGRSVSGRPEEAEGRLAPGHWGGDLVLGGDLSSCLVTVVGRSSRRLEMRRLDSHGGDAVVCEVEGAAEGVPGWARPALLRSLTWDQGVEMAGAARITEDLGVPVFFCHPHAPWEKGTNENTNGLIRQYFPKGTDFRRVSDEEVRRVQDELNNRPRKVLGWRTPEEVLASELERAKVAMTA